MSHKCGKPSSTNVKVSNKKSKAACESCSSLNRCAADSKDLSHHKESHWLQKRKHLKTRKERSHIRAASKVTLRIKSHHQHCRGHCSKDTACFHGCCHCSSVRNPPFPSVAPAAQEHSIITDSRLIGHHGLFNHEVKSVDIERLLSEQKKLKQAGKHVKEKRSAASRAPSTEVKASSSTAGLVAVHSDVLKKADTRHKANDDGHQRRKKNLQFSDEDSDITPGQRSQRQPDFSSGSLKSLNYSSISPATSNDVTSEKSKKSHSTPTSSKKAKQGIISTLEQTPNSPELPARHAQPSATSPGPLQHSPPTPADKFDARHSQEDVKRVSKAVGAVAARLCDSLQFPFKKMKNLVSESRRVLLKCLREKHGPWLQENLLELQTCPELDTVPTKAVQEAGRGFTVREDDGFTSHDAFHKRIERRHSKWKSNQQLYRAPQQPKRAAWLPFPEENSVRGLEDFTASVFSSQFCADSEPSKPLARVSFAASPMSCHDEMTFDAEHCRDALFTSNSQEPLGFDSFESSFLKHTNTVREQRYMSQQCDGKTQPPFTYQATLPDRCSVEEMDFPQHQDPFRATREPFAPSVSAQEYLAHHNRPLPVFNKFSDHPHLSCSSHSTSHPHLSCSSHSTSHPHMMYFPPSHTLERGSRSPPSSFSSPERWSFPAMRLY